MIDAIRQQVIVQPGGLIELQSADLPVGARGEVIVLVESSSKSNRSLRNMMGTAKQSFANVKEVDTFIRQERDSWES
jgi:hypothetical protein